MINCLEVCYKLSAVVGNQLIHATVLRGSTEGNWHPCINGKCTTVFGRHCAHDSLSSPSVNTDALVDSMFVCGGAFHLLQEASLRSFQPRVVGDKLPLNARIRTGCFIGAQHRFVKFTEVVLDLAAPNVSEASCAPRVGFGYYTFLQCVFLLSSTN